MMAMDYSRHTDDQLDECLAIHTEAISKLDAAIEELNDQLDTRWSAREMRTEEKRALIKERSARHNDPKA